MPESLFAFLFTENGPGFMKIMAHEAIIEDLRLTCKTKFQIFLMYNTVQLPLTMLGLGKLFHNSFSTESTCNVMN